MCGFVSYENATIREYPDWVDALEGPPELGEILKQWPNYVAYPAFGGDTQKTIPLLIYEEERFKRVDAIWWFDAFVEEQATFLGKRTSFNARNLDSPFWKGALNHNRGVVLASELGESKLVGKTKHQYLMQSHEVFLLGALYRKLPNGIYCCAIITRDAHPKMEPYHDKAFPLFLPTDKKVIQTWTSKDEDARTYIQEFLDEPKLYPTLHVQRVKTYKGKQPVGQINDLLISDLA